MTDEGPTTVGSIVAKLKMDRDQWVADKDRTKADARELGALNPTIRIDVDTSRAMAQIEALRVAAESAGVVAPGQITPSGPSASTAAARANVDALAAAQARLAAKTEAATAAIDEAESRQYAALQRLAIAKARESELTSKATVAESRELAVRLASTQAQKAASDATAKLALAQKALVDTAHEEALATLEDAASQDVDTHAKNKNTTATNKAASANKNNLGFMGLIIGAAAVLIPMLVPLAANVVAVTGAFSGMGVAGVLGLLGVKNAMAAGTAEGAQFSTGLQALKGDLSQLEGTAAAGMLAMFNTAVVDINAAMPSLNGEVSNFTGLLSGVTGSVLPGILNGFRVLNPLFMDAGQHIQAIADGFLRWTQDGGLQQFAAYAISTIPQVEGTLQALGSAIVHILQALTPLGTVGLGVLQDLSNVINAMPVPVLTAITVGALSGFAAFKLWAAVAPILQNAAGAVAMFAGAETTAGVAATGFGIAVKTAMGPIGLVVAIVGALAGAIAISAAAADQASASMATYTDALTQDNGVIGANVRAQAAKALVDNGAIANGKLLGLSAKTVTEAALGQSTAMTAVKNATKAASDTWTAGQHVAGRYAVTVSQLSDKQIAAKHAADDLTSKVKAQKDAIDATVKSGIDYNSAMSIGGSVAQTLATDLGMTVSGYEQLVSAQNTATAAAKTWKTETDILNGVAQSLEQTTINLAGDYQTMAKQITGNIKSMGKAAATSLDINTAGGLANHQIILKSIQDAQAQADNIDQSVTKQTGSKAKGDAAAAAFAAADKGRLLDTLTGLGLNRQAVQDVIDKMDLLHSPPPVVVTVQTAAAMAQISTVLAALAAVPAAARTSVGVDLSQMPVSGVMAKFSTLVAKHAGGGTIQGPGSSTSDSVPILASAGEEMIRAASAGFDRPFLKAYNANPGKALAEKTAAMAGGNVSVQVVNKSGAAIGDLIEMYIENAAGRRKVNLSTGMQRVAY